MHKLPQPSALASCIACHKDYDKKHNLMHAKFFGQSDKRKSNKRLPDCIDCHLTDSVLVNSQPEGFVNKKRFFHYVRKQEQRLQGSQNRCIVCHPSEFLQFSASAHFAALREGSKDAPTCLTCHNIYQAEIPDTLALCAGCHLDETKFHSEKKRKFIAGYFTEFHGRLALANLQHKKIGETDKIKRTLECKYCHTAHSARKDANYKRICVQCHLGADASFAGAIIPHGRYNTKMSDNFTSWLIALFGKLALAICFFLALIDNLVSVLKYSPRKKCPVQ